MQQPIAGSTRARSGEGLCPCASCNWLLYPAPTSAQDGLDLHQLTDIRAVVCGDWFTHSKTFWEEGCLRRFFRTPACKIGKVPVGTDSVRALG